MGYFYGAQALGEYAFTDLLAAHDLSVPTPARLLLLDLNSDLTFVLETTPFFFAPEDATGTPHPFIHYEVLPLPTAEDIGANVIRIGDKSLNTFPADNPPNFHIIDRLKQSYDFDAQVPQPTANDSRGRISFGQIVINNGDRELDYLTRMVWGGETIEIKVGGTFDLGLSTEQTLLFKEYDVIFKGIIDRAEWNNDNITFTLRPFGEKLDSAIQDTVYTGTGGLNGTANLKGKFIPLAYGTVDNIKPPLVDEANLIYQVNESSVQAISAVRDKGVALAFNQNVADIEAADGSLGAGEYNTSLANGYIKLGASPDGDVTVDIEGDNTGGYIDKVSEIILRIATQQGSIVDPDDIDNPSFAAMDLSITETVGYFTGTAEVKMTTILDNLMRGVGGYWYFNRNGQLRIGIWSDPDTTTHLQTLTEDDVKQESIRKEQALAPVWRYRLGYRKMWHVQDADSLAASVSDANKNLFGNEFRLETSEDTATLTRYPDAREVTIDTYLDALADATTLITSRIARDKKGRDVYKITRLRSLFQYNIGDVIRLQFDKFDLQGGKNFLVVGYHESANERATELTLYG